MARKPKDKTSQAKIESNRRNAQQSTGPKTPEGKAVSRRNALKHGMTANPAIAMVEDPSHYESLLEALNAQIQPTNVFERDLVDQIASSLWRLQRAKRAETAATSIAVRAVPTDQAKIAAWRRRLEEDWHDRAFYVEEVRELDPAGKKKPRLRGEKPQYRERFRREGLRRLDNLWDELYADPYGLKALIAMLDELSEILFFRSYYLTPTQFQQIAWILGESADRIHANAESALEEEGLYFPYEKPWASRIDKILGAMREMRTVADGPDADDLIRLRREDLTRRYHHVMSVDAHQSKIDARNAALLPTKEVLDGVCRYENHARRQMKSAVETLALIRGLSVTTVMQRITVVDAGRGQSAQIDRIQVQKDQTLGTGAGADRAARMNNAASLN